MRTEKKLYDKAWKRTTRDTVNERDLGYGRVLDFKNGSDVHIFWDLSEDAKADRVFKLVIDGKEYLLDADQFMKYLRWV